MSAESHLRCLECGENLIRESPITPVGASIFEQQEEKPRLQCPACGAINMVRWSPDEGFRAVGIGKETSEDPLEQRGLFCLSCGSRMELSPPPWKKPTQIIEARDRVLAICGACGSKNEVETVEGRTVAGKLA